MSVNCFPSPAIPASRSPKIGISRKIDWTRSTSFSITPLMNPSIAANATVAADAITIPIVFRSVGSVSIAVRVRPSILVTVFSRFTRPAMRPCSSPTESGPNESRQILLIFSTAPSTGSTIAVVTNFCTFVTARRIGFPISSGRLSRPSLIEGMTAPKDSLTFSPIEASELKIAPRLAAKLRAATVIPDMTFPRFCTNPRNPFMDVAPSNPANRAFLKARTVSTTAPKAFAAVLPRFTKNEAGPDAEAVDRPTTKSFTAFTAFGITTVASPPTTPPTVLIASENRRAGSIMSTSPPIVLLIDVNSSGFFATSTPIPAAAAARATPSTPRGEADSAITAVRTRPRVSDRPFTATIAPRPAATPRSP